MRTRLLFSYRKGAPESDVSARKMRANIRRVYRLAHALEISYGRAWYRVAWQESEKIAKLYGVDARMVAHLVAALSPNNAWLRNLRDVRALLGEVIERKTARYSTYGANVRKARAILGAWLQSAPYDGILRGNKVTAFARNIIEHDRANGVTVDFHALSVAHGFRYTVKTCPRISDKLYNEVSAAYVGVAREYGLLPQELQAIVWLAWKRIFRV